MDASNLLKPMLARGELRCIGATTLDEYRKHIEKDPALERRFQQVFVDQPTVEDTISILRGLKERYEVHHGVRIADNALVAAAVLSSRYIADRFLPDKAIDLMDESAAKLKMEVTSKPEEIDELDRKHPAAGDGETVPGPRIRCRQQGPAGAAREGTGRSEGTAEHPQCPVAAGEGGDRSNSAPSRKKSSRSAAGGAGQAQLRPQQGRRAGIRHPGRTATRSWRPRRPSSTPENGEKTLLREEVTEDDIAEVIAKWTGIPVSQAGAVARWRNCCIWRMNCTTG
jgi:ATP-dependent Clp protease ATP-binding subunit ClpB